MSRQQTEYDRLQRRVHAMYVDKLDGRIDAAMYDKLSADMRIEQDKCLREIGWHQNADQSYLTQGAQLLELASDAHQMFATEAPSEKRRLLNFVVSNTTWKNGELSAKFRQPFDLLAETTVMAAHSGGGNGATSAQNEIWLGN